MSTSFSVVDGATISAFDRRLSLTPSEWRGPLVDVVDTFASLKVGLSEIGINDTACLIEAVKLVLDRHDRSILREQALTQLDLFDADPKMHRRPKRCQRQGVAA